MEKWLNEYKHYFEVDISETCVEAFAIGEFLHLMGWESFFNEMWDIPLTKVYIPGSLGLRTGIFNLYKRMGSENILIT